MFKIKWEEKALKELYKLEYQISSRIYKKVDELMNGFESKDIKKIRSEDKFRLRVGNYRVIFSLEKNIIKIWKIEHKKNIYKRI
jgi:mRNA interferase RelE/StbE